jgi:hypothetical protein
MSELDIFLLKHKDLNIIFLTKFGSHLYGTSTEKSDQDFKGVFIPTIEECILNKIPKQLSNREDERREERPKNTGEDTDIELYSLQYFLKLLKKGDTGALDMLHVPLGNTDLVLRKTPIWQFLNDHRSDFYTTNLAAFVGYCRTQASKYGIKGSRLSDAKNVVEFFEPMLNQNPGMRLHECWDRLPEGEHIFKISWEDHNIENLHAAKLKTSSHDRFDFYQVCGRNLQSTITISHAYEIVAKFYEAYGKRAQLASENKGINWKAVSHAMRASYEMESIYTKGDIIFPLEQAEDLRKIKNGELDYQDNVAPRLEFIMAHVEKHAEKSPYPFEVNIKKYEEWLVKIYSHVDKVSLTLSPEVISSVATSLQNKDTGPGK